LQAHEIEATPEIASDPHADGGATLCGAAKRHANADLSALLRKAGIALVLILKEPYAISACDLSAQTIKKKRH
jgi:hypothetical protein